MIMAYNIADQITMNSKLPAATPINYNGVTLQPSLCTVRAALNGAWTLSIEHPIDNDGLFRYVEVNTVLSVPSFNGQQLFRIKQREKNDDGVKATADPIFFDSKNNLFLEATRITNKNGQNALNAILSGSNYSATSDITYTASAYYVRKNAMEAISGNDDNSFLNRWGGEIEYDNYTIKVMNQIGDSRGLSIQYGSALETGSLEESFDVTKICTRIYPTGYKGRTPDGYSYVDSPILASYPIVYAQTIQFPNIALMSDLDPGQDTDGMIICADQNEFDTELDTACDAYFLNTYCDAAIYSIDCRVTDLEAIAKASGVPEIPVYLGDYVEIIDSRLEVGGAVRITEIEWDCINDRAESIRLTTQNSVIPPFPS